MNTKKLLILFSIFSFAVFLVFIYGCKKIDLVKIAAVNTESVDDISANGARANGKIIDLGAQEEVSDFGFCWAINKTPTINDFSNSNGSTNILRTYSYLMNNLDVGTNYSVRAYVLSGGITTYGDVIEFETFGTVGLPSVTTNNISNITGYSATSGGNVTNDGNGNVTARGVCWDTSPNPTLQDYSTLNGTGTGTFSSQITGLNPETMYYVRAYVTNSAGTAYGDQKTFTTEAGGPPTGTWFNYDDGTFYTGIGRTGGGSFDLAIRIPTNDLQDYHGFSISKVKFYVSEGYPVEYNLTIWEGSVTPDLINDENIPNYNVNTWTEYTPNYQHVINSNLELWVGLWVQDHLADTYPAGVDDGPAIAGKGDMISFDDGGEWQTLSSGGLDYNWNFQVYVSNYKGEEKQLLITNPKNRDRVLSTNKKSTGSNVPVAKKQKSNILR